ncbi:hypothetical protein DOTSEDRAFT_67463 [Dothistroma septosporum NZE10]|uniref:Uncharacterized protein n=1 Tax=Dothistroma septosporum (strain NZE10 / CBS 128990) TaxID=675120 RepID=N1Q1P0_DOTSN|nr:hypothetical protein DOTSEDRAFT_67463 [Dothistroma septosporum NZE10]
MTPITMSYDFTVSRYHAVAWSVVGLAAAYGVYTAWSTNLRAPVTSLHRSNAIHRSRRQVMEILYPTSEAPLGQIVFRDGDTLHMIRLGAASPPTQAQLMISDERYREIQGIAVEMTLQACFTASRDATLWVRFSNELGFGDLLRALSDRDEDHILDVALRIPGQLRIINMSREQVEQAVAGFLDSASWRAFADMSSVDSAADPAETEDIEPSNGRREPSQGLRGLLYHIAEDDAKRKAYEHRGISCEECGETPIRGVRWHCLNCPDYDLCSACEMHTTHTKTHVFAKIKIPLPVLSQPTKQYTLWYPGDPRKVHAPLDSNLQKRLCQEHGFEEPQMDALYDQFTCIANVPYPSDDGIKPSCVKAAIDRRAFNKALTSERWANRFAPNALYDRTFAFYDTDRKGFIGFEDFVSGLAYLRGPKRFATLGRAARGFDLDDDGYINRKDMLRLFEAKFAINQQLVEDVTEGQELQQTQKGMDTLRSSQPISSILAYDDIPPGENRAAHGKEPDAHGDMQPLHGTKTVLDDDDPWRKSTTEPSQPLEQLQYHLSHFGELIPAIDPLPTVDGAAGLSSGEVPSTLPIIDVNGLHDDDSEEPHIADALWQVTQQGLNELLDGLFQIREEEDREVEETAGERKKWRQQINKELEPEPRASGPMAVALDDPSNDRSNPDSPPVFSSEIISTDHDTLAQRERTIANRPLEDLLADSGYGLRESGEPSRGPRPSPLRNEILREDSEEPSGTQVKDTRLKETHQPRNVQLSHWGNVVDANERAMQERGGPGRLSYDEIETIVVDDPSGELRGLVKHWLEWAAF